MQVTTRSLTILEQVDLTIDQYEDNAVERIQKITLSTEEFEDFQFYIDNNMIHSDDYRVRNAREIMYRDVLVFRGSTPEEMRLADIAFFGSEEAVKAAQEELAQ